MVVTRKGAIIDYWEKDQGIDAKSAWGKGVYYGIQQAAYISSEGLKRMEAIK